MNPSLHPYEVHVPLVGNIVVRVSALNEQAAREIALKRFSDGSAYQGIDLGNCLTADNTGVSVYPDGEHETTDVATIQLTGRALSYAVARAEDETVYVENGRVLDVNRLEVDYTSDAQAMPICDREGILTEPDTVRGGFRAKAVQPSLDEVVQGPTKAIAAMRWYLRGKLGAFVNVPRELVGPQP